ncbi:MAG: hypothetical protein ACREIW_03185, partial [Chthoniobacterales bacterium]
MTTLAYIFGILGLCLILAIFSWLDHIYRQMGRMTTERIRQHVESFESEIEPRLRRKRSQAALGFSILTNIALVAVAVVTARGALVLVPKRLDAVLAIAVYL